MFKYFQYIELNTFKRKSIWISAGVYWLYIAVIILIIPAILQTPPAILWTNGVIDLQGFCMMILAIVCSIMAVVIFRESRDDGTELIIMSKPINRWKIIIVKFISYLLTSTIVITGGVILMLCTLFFGRYSANNLDGIDYSLLPGMVGGLVLAGFITILLFGAIAILISAFAGKVAIMITTIGIAIIINVLQQVLPFAATTPSSYVKSNYSMELMTHRPVSTDGKMHNSFNAEHVAVIDGVNYDSLFYAKQGLDHATGAIACYANIGQQITNLYHAFATKEESVMENTPFGSRYDKKYTITNNEKSIFQDANGSEDNKDYANSNIPWIRLESVVDQGVWFMRFRIYGSMGIEGTPLEISSLAGATADTMYRIEPIKASSVVDLIDTSFYNIDEITKYRDADKVNEYVDWLMRPEDDPAGGCGITPEYIQEAGSSAMQRIRTQFGDDLLGNWMADNVPDINSPQRNILNGTCLLNDVYPDQKYNKNMDMDFLQIFFLMQKKIQQQLWSGIQGDIKNNFLKPVSKWNDYDTVDDPYTHAKPLREWWTSGIIQAKSNRAKIIVLNDAMYWLRFSEDKPLHTYFLPFSVIKTTPGWTTGWDYADPARENWRINDYHGIMDWSQRFSSTFSYDQTELIMRNPTIIFWTTLSLLLFGLTAIVYARTDIK